MVRRSCYTLQILCRIICRTNKLSSISKNILSSRCRRNRTSKSKIKSSSRIIQDIVKKYCCTIYILRLRRDGPELGRPYE